MEEHLEISLEAIDISQFRLRSEAIRPAFEFKKKHDPAFSNMTGASFAAKVGIGESTWKKLYAGTATDAMCSTAWAIAKPLGLDPAVLFGLAPSRDYEREKQEYNPTLMDNMRRQIAADAERIQNKIERIADLESQIAASASEQDRLRKLYLSKAEECSRLQERSASLENMLSTRDQSIVKHDEVRASNITTINHLVKQNRRGRFLIFFLTLSTVILAALMIYFLWELNNPNAGNFRFN